MAAPSKAHCTAPPGPAPDAAVPPELLLLSVQQAAHVLGISRSRVYQLVRAGELRVVKLGGLTKVLRHDLDAFVAGLRDPREGAAFPSTPSRRSPP